MVIIGVLLGIFGSLSEPPGWRGSDFRAAYLRLGAGLRYQGGCGLQFGGGRDDEPVRSSFSLWRDGRVRLRVTLVSDILPWAVGILAHGLQPS